ncbi:MAG TPA: hypothetical protein VFJ97_12020 [Dermatophilaceae bacterium]|nr:hypothetical protein [Dermatophilaceae bacterium]
MTITPTTLTRAAGIAASAAGLIFAAVQIKHPHLDATSITTTEVAVRNSLKVLMAALALVGISGMYLHQVKQMGKLGLLGYLLFAANYLVIMSTSFVAAYVLPSIAESNPSFVNDVLTAANGGHATGDIGLLQIVLWIEAFLFLAGGLVFGIALYRARVLSRWASVLLAIGGIVSAALSLMPDAFHRLLALPNSVALVALGYSLWLAAGSDTTAQPATVVGTPTPTAAGVR